MSRRERRAAKTRRIKGRGVMLIALAALFLGAGCALRSPTMNEPSNQGISPSSGDGREPRNTSSQDPDKPVYESVQRTDSDTSSHTDDPTAPETPISPGARIAAAKRSIEEQSSLLWGAPPPLQGEQTQGAQKNSEDPAPDPNQAKTTSKKQEPSHDGAGGDATTDSQTGNDQSFSVPHPTTQPVNMPRPAAPPADTEATEATEPPSEDTAHCDQTCDAASGICESSEAICEIAQDHPLDETFQVDCAWADQVCTRAQDTCAQCQAAH